MFIQVFSVTTGTGTSAAGKPYQKAEIAFKNMDSGKVESKNITQYSKVFKQVAEAITGQTYNVTVVKNDKTGYWDWEGFALAQPGQVPVAAPTAAPGFKSAAVAAPKSNYETPEERAKRQVFIVKQSSITAALKMIELNKDKPTFANVTSLAQELSDWVFAEKKQDLFDEPNDPFNGEVE